MTDRKPETVILMIEEGAFKGLRMLISKENLNKPVKHALVEKGEMFGRPHFAMACLIHETFGNDKGCPECNELESKE